MTKFLFVCTGNTCRSPIAGRILQLVPTLARPKPSNPYFRYGDAPVAVRLQSDCRDLMFKPQFTINNRINNSLLEIERARGFLDATNIKEGWIREMQSEALVAEAHYSTHITIQRDISKFAELQLVEEIAKSKTDPTKRYKLL